MSAHAYMLLNVTDRALSGIICDTKKALRAGGYEIWGDQVGWVIDRMIAAKAEKARRDREDLDAQSEI